MTPPYSRIVILMPLCRDVLLLLLLLLLLLPAQPGARAGRELAFYSSISSSSPALAALAGAAAPLLTGDAADIHSDFSSLSKDDLSSLAPFMPKFCERTRHLLPRDDFHFFCVPSFRLAGIVSWLFSFCWSSILAR